MLPLRVGAAVAGLLGRGGGERGVERGGESSGGGVGRAINIDGHPRAMPRHRGWPEGAVQFYSGCLGLVAPVAGFVLQDLRHKQREHTRTNT